MNTKIIKLDINKKMYETISAKQGDTESRFLLFHLFDSSLPFDLTEKSVRVYGIKPDEKKIFNDLVINDAKKGYCTLELTNQMLSVAGLVKLELVIYKGSKKLSSIPFVLNVISSLNSEDAIVSTNEFTALMNGLAALSEYDTYKSNAKQVPVIKEEVSNLSAQLEHITTYITPEMFGCIGDGIIDDTVNLQRCIDYAISKKVSIKSKSYKKYKISDTINVNGTVNIDFNNSTLLATTKSDVININHVGVNTFNGTIENLIIDCNDISECGLKITYSQRRLFKSVKVINLKAIGIDIVAGNVNKFSYIWIEGKNVNINTIGFRNNCYDMVVSHMDIINCHVSIEHNRGNCFYSECHGFITNPDILYKDSIFYKQTCYHHVVLDKCYPDTQQYWYYISDIAKLNIIGNYGFTSNEILNSNTFADGTRGYIFFFEDSNQRYSSRVSISDSMLQGIKIDGINRYLFTNLADENSLIKINSTVHPYNFDALRTCSTNALTNLNSQITFNKNIIKLAKETYTLQVEFEYNPSILGVLSSTIGRSIGNLPSSYMYVSDGDFSFPVESGIIDEQGYKCLGFLKGLVKSNS